MIVKDDSYNTNPETLKEVPKNYVTMITNVTITDSLANKYLWLQRSYPYGQQLLNKILPINSLNYLAIFYYKSLRKSFIIT